MKKRLFIVVSLLILCAIPILAREGGPLENVNWDTVIKVVFGFIMTVFGGLARWFKLKSGKMADFSKQSMEAAMAANDLVQHHKLAIEDGDLSKKELEGYVPKAQKVAKETGEAIAAFKTLFKKDPGK